MEGVLGVDVAKDKFEVALILGDKMRRQGFANGEAGFEALAAWLARHGAGRVHACLEATGGYGEDLALFLHAAGHVVSIVNPLRIKAYAQSELVRTKTDGVDAGVAARFCLAQRPQPWTPPSPRLRELRALVRRCAALKQMRVQEMNRAAAAAVTPRVAASIAAIRAALEAEIAAIAEEIRRLIADDPKLRHRFALLTSLPGIGPQSAAVLMSEIPDFAAFGHGKQIAAFAGLTPREHRSGSSVNRPSRLSKIGNPLLRSTMFLCALSARRHNPVLKTFADRLEAAGKAKKPVLAAVARKLLVIAYGIVKHDKPFDPMLDVQHGI